jgi:hypothetical protein
MATLIYYVVFLNCNDHDDITHMDPLGNSTVLEKKQMLEI